MYLFNKIKNCFLTLLSSILVGGAFFIFSILALILSWIVFIFFSVMTIFASINE